MPIKCPHCGIGSGRAEGRRRVRESFGVTLEPEVQVLGEVDWPEGWDLDEAP